jgi:hypothetical protein
VTLVVAIENQLLPETLLAIEDTSPDQSKLYKMVKLRPCNIMTLKTSKNKVMVNIQKPTFSEISRGGRNYVWVREWIQG